MARAQLTRWFTGDIISYACDAVNLVDNTCRNPLEQAEIKLVRLWKYQYRHRISGRWGVSYLRRHKVEGLDGAQTEVRVSHLLSTKRRNVEHGFRNGDTYMAIYP